MTTRPECPLVRERLPALLENGLAPGETLLVRAHVEGCDGCASELESYATLAGDVVATRDAGGFEAARAALDRTLDQTRPGIVRTLSPRGRLLVAAAAVAACVGVAWLEPPTPSLDELRLASTALIEPIDAFLPGFRLSDLGAGLTAPGDAR